MIDRPRRALLAALAALPVELHAQSLPSFAAGDRSLRPRLLDEGEAALRRGDAVAALEAFERASAMLHAADADMGIVRAMMLEGGYRRALAFAAHAAGAHRDAPAASALYAWLLAMGGQGDFARRVLGEAEARSGADALLADSREALGRTRPLPPARLLDAPQRAAPYAVFLDGGVPPPVREMLPCGILLDAGRSALVPSGRDAAPTMLRDARGRCVTVRLERHDEALGVSLLRLETPLSVAAPDLPSAASDPYAGSPASVVTIAGSDASTPAWPWLVDGFAGGADPAQPGVRRLLFELPAGAGGAVFDGQGRLAGLALGDAAPSRRWLPLSRLRSAFGTELLPPPAAARTGAATTPDQVLERAFGIVVQPLV